MAGMALQLFYPMKKIDILTWIHDDTPFWNLLVAAVFTRAQTVYLGGAEGSFFDGQLSGQMVAIGIRMIDLAVFEPIYGLIKVGGSRFFGFRAVGFCNRTLRRRVRVLRF
jgi:hypothetical protein